MANRIVIILFFCLNILLNSFAQDSTEYSFLQIQENIAEILNQSGDEINLDELSDYLYQLSTNPVNINSTDNMEITRLFWLTEFQIAGIVQYIEKNGALRSIYELPYIEGFNEQDARLMLPFITFEMPGKKTGIKDYFRYPKQTVLARSNKVIEKQAGYNQGNTNGFVGSPVSFYTRYHIYNENFSAGITGDKDAGEEFFTGNNSRGFDFYSYHVQLNNLGFIKTIIAGDYKLNFGNGLIAGSAFNLGKTPSVLSSAYQNSGITKYTATNENNFFRGIACTFLKGKTELSLFYSGHALDANVIKRDTLNNEIIEVSTLQTSGMHTTYSELSDKDAIRSQVLGTNIKYCGTYLEVGITALYTKFTATLNPAYEPYNADYFRGNENINMGINYRIRTSNILWFGEESVSKNGSFATLNGIQAHPFPALLLNVIYRNYGNKYQALYGNAFGENSRNQNERGLYAGLHCSLFKYISLTGYVDFYSFPKVRYEVDMPSEGQEYMGQITYTPNSIFQLYVQYKNKQKEINEIQPDSPLALLVLSKTEHFRLGLSYKVSSNLTMRNRMEIAVNGKGISDYSDGYLIAQDMDYKFSIFPIRFYARYALFDISDYESRIYAYESDVLYAFSIPSFYNKGFRFCFMTKISPSKSADFWIKYSITQYTDKETISSGLYEINGNRKSEIRLQLLLKLKGK